MLSLPMRHSGRAIWRSRPWIGALLLLPMVPCTAVAQESTVVLLVQAVDATTGEPIRGARVLVQRLSAGTTNAEGIARLSGLRPGTITGEIAHPSYETRQIRFPAAAGVPVQISVPLEPRPIMLEGVAAEVRASPHGVRSRGLRNFYKRADGGGAGHYVTRDQIESWNARRITDLFRAIPGLELVHTPVGTRVAVTARHAPSFDLRGRIRECPIQYFLDGSPYDAGRTAAIYLDLRPEEIEGIEVYIGTVGVPPEFRRSNRNCGTIVIWKRERG